MTTKKNSKTTCAVILQGMLLAIATTAFHAATAQSLEWVKSSAYRLKYQVPLHWTQVRQANDTLAMITHVSPDGEMMLSIDKFKGAAAQLTPQQALTRWLQSVGGTDTRFFPTQYNGIRFLETTGTGLMNGRLIRYDAMAGSHRGHLILVNVYATPSAYQAHQATLLQVIHSISPYKGK